MPLGFFTVAIDSVLVSALQWGLLPAVDRRAVALIVFPAFVVQVIVGIFAFHGRDSIAATLMMSFAMAHPLGGPSARPHGQAQPGPRSSQDGSDDRP